MEAESPTLCVQSCPTLSTLCPYGCYYANVRRKAEIRHKFLGKGGRDRWMDGESKDERGRGGGGGKIVKQVNVMAIAYVT